MADDSVNVKITADASGVAPGVDTAKAAVSGLSENAKAASESMRASFASVSTSVQEMGIRIRETVGVVGEMREAMMAFGEAMIAAFAFEEVKEFAEHMGEAAEKVLHLSETFGMTTPQVQGLQGVAAASGVSFDTLSRGIGIFDKNLQTASTGTGPAAQAFKALGISAKDGADQMELVTRVADKFKGMDDGPKKVALAMALFGRSGKDMIPFLDLGSEGIQKLDAETQRYSAGALIATQANQGLRDWLQEVNAKGVALAEAMNESHVAMQGVSNVLTDALAPFLQVCADGLNTLVEKFIESYREGGIVAVVIQTISGILDELASVVSALWDIWQSVWNGIKEIIADVASAIADGIGTKVPSATTLATIGFNVFKDAVTVAKDTIVIGIDAIVGAVEFLVGELKMLGKFADDVFTMHWGAIEGDWRAGLNNLAQIVEDTAGKIKKSAAEMSAAIAAGMRGEALPGSKSETHEPHKPRDFNPNLTRPAKQKKEKDEGDKDNSAETDLQEAKDSAKAAEAIAADQAKTVEEIAKLSAQEQLDAVDMAEKGGIITKKQATAQRIAIMQTEVDAEKISANQIYQAKVAEIKAEEDAENASLVAKQGALDKSAKDYTTKYQNLQNQIEAVQIAANNKLEVLEVEHQNQLTVIDAKGVADRKKVEDEALGAQLANINKMTQQFSMGLAQMMTGQRSFMQQIGSLWNGLINIVDKVISQMISQWITGLLVKEGLEKASQQRSVLVTAKEAAANAYKAMAGIPIVGPALGAAAAVATFAAVEGFSAAGGWGNVPYDGALTELHKNEMVLPASIATPIRAMAANYNGANDEGFGGIMGGGDTHIHIHATDADSVKRLLSSEDGIAGIRAALHKAGAGLKM